MAGMQIIKPLMLVGIFSLIYRSPSLTRRDVLATPIDWMILIYCGFLLYSSPDPIGSFMQVIPYVATYFITTLALTDHSHINRYLGWWLICLGIIAAVGVLTQFGIDITGAQEKIDQMVGRLLLNTWLLNNPNALGHTVILAIPIAYLLLWWKRSAGYKLVAIALIALTYNCMVFTQSKGSFLVAAGAVVVAVTFGRPKIVQIIVLTIALSIGTGGLMFLPRMGEMNNLRADEGVQGRLMVWEVALTTYRSSFSGQGWRQFNAEIVWEGERYNKATHSSFVKVGADLGPIGMFLFLTLLCMGARAMIQYPGFDESAERSRRIIFVLLASYFASGWMIDRAYHTEYFLILALASAYMRLAVKKREEEIEQRIQPEEIPSGDETLATPAGSPDFLPWPFSKVAIDPGPSSAATVLEAPMLGTDTTGVRNTRDPSRAKVDKVDDDSSTRKKKLWRKIGVLDLILGFAALRIVVWLWDYILKNI